jgi:hypothetical protein
MNSVQGQIHVWFRNLSSVSCRNTYTDGKATLMIHTAQKLVAQEAGGPVAGAAARLSHIGRLSEARRNC